MRPRWIPQRCSPVTVFSLTEVLICPFHILAVYIFSESYSEKPNTHLLCPKSHSCCCLWVYVNPVPQFAFLRQRSFTAYNSSPPQVSQCVRVYPVWVGLISQPWGARMPGSHRRQSSRCRTCATQQRAGADLWGNEPGILVRAARAHRLMQERSLVTPWSRSPPQLNAMILLAPVGILLTLPSHPVFWTFILVLLWNIFS